MEQLRNRKTVRGWTQWYLVRWNGRDASESAAYSWEPTERLANCPERVAASEYGSAVPRLGLTSLPERHRSCRWPPSPRCDGPPPPQSPPGWPGLWRGLPGLGYALLYKWTDWQLGCASAGGPRSP